MATLSLYEHTAKRFAEGSNTPSDNYKVMLCTSATFVASNATLASITKTEVANGNGYITGGATLANVAVSSSGSSAKFGANDVTWAVTGAGTSISASSAILYNNTDANSPPVLFISFGGTRTVSTGNNFVISWDAAGIITFTVA
jgi:hypothetical protein